MKKYALIIDHISCWGCKTCEVACKQENDAPEGVKLIAVFEEGFNAADDKTDVIFQSNVCVHCDEPACVESCPEEAIAQRDDGIVVLDEETCNGCQLCMYACPYHAISFDTQKDVAKKCNLCHHRVDNGLIPACADNVCLAHCIYFGDPDDIQLQINEKHLRRNLMKNEVGHQKLTKGG
jgi:Fe-S-cluster-containing dehydrogenase component